MVNVTTTHTVPVNPPGATPVLTLEQLWKALEIKARNPKLFLPEVISCEVISESENTIVRKVSFEGLASGEIEEVLFRPPYIAAFSLPSNGTAIQNIISHGPSLGPTDLFLTHTFHFQRPDVPEGTKEAEELAAKMISFASTGPSHTVEAARGLVVKGEV